MAFLAFLARQFDVDLAATWAQIHSADPWLYLSACASYYASFALRGLRWRLMGASAGIHRGPGGRLPSTGQCALMILEGWFINSLVWLRMGDAYRAYTLTVASRGTFSRSLGVLLSERITDAIAVFILLLAAMAALLLTRELRPPLLFLLISLVLVLAGLLAILLLATLGPRLGRHLPPRWRETYERFLGGTLGSLPQFPLVVALGVGGWLLEAGRLFLVIKALGLSVGSSLVLFTASANGILTSVPLTPGGLGVVEPGIAGIMALKLPQSSAVSVALLDRSISYLSVIPVGAVIFLLRRFWLGGRKG